MSDKRFRLPEPRRSELVAQYSEAAIAQGEDFTTDWLTRLVKGDLDAPEPRGFLRGSSVE